MNIILVSGKARSGKDTVARIIRDTLRAHDKCPLIVHLADLVKFSCEKFWAWDGIKDDAGRTLLQEVGTDKVRSCNSYYWINYIRDMLKLTDGRWDTVIIPDCRFANEIDKGTWCDLSTNTVTIRVERPEESALLAEQKQHVSETELDNYQFDYIINNDVTFDGLIKKVMDVLRESKVLLLN